MSQGRMLSLLVGELIGLVCLALVLGQVVTGRMLPEVFFWITLAGATVGLLCVGITFEALPRARR